MLITELPYCNRNGHYHFMPALLNNEPCALQGMLNIDRNTIRSSGIYIAIDVSDDFKQTMMSMSNFQSKVCVIWKGNPLNTLSTVFQSLFCCGYLSKSFDYTKIINANYNEINSLYVRFPDFLIYIHLVIFHYFEFKKE